MLDLLAILITLSAIFSYEFSAGTTSVTCTVTDQGGNSATSDPFDVIVEDIPVITALEDTLVIPTDGGTTAPIWATWKSG